VHAGDATWDDEIRAAAIRELFEEVGILLARKGRRFARERDCTMLRDRVEGGATFGGALRELGMEPAFDRLIMFARWVTPAQVRRRFDARFFLARLPAGQSVHPQEEEVADWMWISPERALADPEVTLVYATRVVLESVATGENVTALMARARRMREIPTVEPRIVQTENGWEIVRD
jgi:8-oxo-dGTP pyrophosphatase MutT (NUDIX family)